jgi:hypothetical protein
MKAGRILTLAVLACAMTLALQSTASAVVLAGNYTGPIKMKFSDFDMGTVYATQTTAPGTTTGLTPTSTPTLASQVIAPATGALGGETTWGIATVTLITDLANNVLWAPGPGSYISAMFYGEVDNYLRQDTAQFQYIEGYGLKVDFWEKATNTFDATLGAAGRTGVATYTGITDGGAVNILSLASTPKFINDAGTNGGLATEFQSHYNSAAQEGNGVAFMNVTGGAQAGIFDTGTFVSAVDPTAPNADVKLQWTILPNSIPGDPNSPFVGGVPDGRPAGNEWLVLTDDPVRASVIPEPLSIIIWSLLGVVGLTVSWWRRRA